MLRVTRGPSGRTIATLLAVSLAACGDGKEQRPTTVVSHDPVVVTPVTPSQSATGFVVDPNASFEQAESTYRAGSHGEASEMFAAYTKRRPGNPWGHYMLGLASWKSGQLDRARGAFERALELDSSHVKSLVNLSRVLLDQERPDEALVRARQALAIDSANGDAWRVLGRAHGSLGNVEDAVTAYRTALAIDPDDTWSMNNMGLVLIRAGRYEEALLPLARAVQLDDAVPQFRNNLGIALERTGRFVLAEREYRSALETDSGYAKARVSLDRVAGRTDEPGVAPVEISALGDSFASLVLEWRSARVAATPVEQSPDSSVLPPSEEQKVSNADSTLTPR